jgi:glycine hydroxymethyltransferase
MMNRTLAQADREIARILSDELDRQKRTLMLIPSENYASRAVMAAAGSVFTNKYAEGYPYKRYYNGCGNYDKLEQLAIDRAKDIFRADHVMCNSTRARRPTWPPTTACWRRAIASLG